MPLRRVVVGGGTALVLCLGLGLGACSGSDPAASPQPSRVATAAGQVLTSPSGRWTAQLVAGVDAGGLPTLVPVIGAGGAEAYRDSTVYRARTGVALAWQEFGGDVLWAVPTSGDGGGSGGATRYDLRGGAWVETPSTDVPADVRDRVGR